MPIGKATIEQGTAVTGAVPLWERIIRRTLAGVGGLLPPGSQVIEVGYGNGILTCYLAQRFGWKITGYESSRQTYEQAVANVKKYDVQNRVELHLVEEEETWKIKGQFDGVFIKTVLYNAATLAEYGKWLDWVNSALKPEGTFINLENGKTNLLTQLYRRLRRRYYTGLCLYDEEIHRLYLDRFELLHVGHYGALSQFIAPLKIPYLLLANIEERVFKLEPGNSFITALVCKKPKR